MPIVEHDQTRQLTDHVLPVVDVLLEGAAVEEARRRRVVHHAQVLQLRTVRGERADERAQVADLILIDPQRVQPVEMRQFHVRRHAVLVDDQRVEMRQVGEKA